jgi:hypothetical protein
LPLIHRTPNRVRPPHIEELVAPKTLRLVQVIIPKVDTTLEKKLKLNECQASVEERNQVAFVNSRFILLLFSLSQKERKEFVGVKWRKNVKNTRKECELKGRQWRE